MNQQETENIEKLDSVINDALIALANFDEGSDDYTKTVNQLKTLYSIKETIADTKVKEWEVHEKGMHSSADLRLKELEIQNGEKAFFWKLPVRSETLVPVIGSLVGIVIVVAYEHTHIVTSKALGMVTNIRR